MVIFNTLGESVVHHDSTSVTLVKLCAPQQRHGLSLSYGLPLGRQSEEELASLEAVPDKANVIWLVFQWDTHYMT